MTGRNIKCEKCGQNFDFDTNMWSVEKILMWLDGWTASNKHIDCNHKWNI